MILSFIGLLLVFLWANLFDDLASLTVAVTRGQTLAQLRDVWNYKQCFDIKNAKVYDEGDPEADSRMNQQGTLHGSSFRHK